MLLPPMMTKCPGSGRTKGTKAKAGQRNYLRKTYANGPSGSRI